MREFVCDRQLMTQQSYHDIRAESDEPGEYGEIIVPEKPAE
jgi:hypothetical protein